MSSVAQCFSSNSTNVCPINTTAPVFSVTSVAETDVSQTIRPSRRKDVFRMYGHFYTEGAQSHINHPSITQFASAIFPQVWKSAAVSPLSKSGDPLSTRGYGPISNQTYSVQSRRETHCSANNCTSELFTSFVLHPTQFGSRAKHSTEKYLLDKGAAFLDLHLRIYFIYWFIWQRHRTLIIHSCKCARVNQKAIFHPSSLDRR